MIDSGFICECCKKKFCVSDYCVGAHGLDSPPYEKIAICPYCGSAEFFEFDFGIEKAEVASVLMSTITKLNRCSNLIKSVFGEGGVNKDLSESISELSEFIYEMFDYIPTKIERRILNCDTDKECECILMYL